jgi:hypothetical protein
MLRCSASLLLKIEEECTGVRGVVSGSNGEGLGCRFEEFGLEGGQSFGVVYVVPEREFDEFEVGFAATGAGLRGYGGGAPVDIGEGGRVGTFEAYEVVTAIVGWTEDYEVAGLAEGFDGLFEGDGLKATVGTVGESESMRQTEP